MEEASRGVAAVASEGWPGRCWRIYPALTPTWRLHMPAYNISVPQANSIDHLAEQREKRDQLVRSRMSKAGYTTAIIEAITEAIENPSTPLGELVEMLFDAPIRDHFDLKAFLNMRDGRLLGKTLIHLVAQCSLNAYDQASGEIGF
jgi:hypothetical protein